MRKFFSFQYWDCRVIKFDEFPRELIDISRYLETIKTLIKTSVMTIY